jgi:hypothetical protein
MGNSCRDVQTPRYGAIDLPMVFLGPSFAWVFRGQMNYVATSYIAADHLYTTAKAEEN